MQQQPESEAKKSAADSSAGNSGYPLVRYLLFATGLAVLLIIAGMFSVEEMADAVFDQQRETPIWNQPAAFYDSADESLNLEHPAETAQIFFTAGDGRLHPQTYYSAFKMNDFQKARFILANLLKGPRNGYLLSALPPGVQLRGVFFIDAPRPAGVESAQSEAAERVIVVNLSDRMALNLSGSPTDEWLALMSIVNSLLVNLKNFQGVRFLIEGNPAESLTGAIDLSQTLKQNFLLIAEPEALAAGQP